MKTGEVTSALRQARPEESTGWAASAEGREVLNHILDSARATGDTSAGRSYLKPILAAAAAVLVALGIVVGLQLGGDQTGVETGYHAADVAFFQHLQFDDGVLEVENYDSLESAAQAVSAVVVGQVVDVVHTRTITGEEPWDQLPMIGVVIRPREVLRGRLPGQFSRQLTVEFMTSGDPQATIDDMKASLPRGRSVWFLRSKAEESQSAPDKAFYRLASSQGLFIQGQNHVANPAVNPGEAHKNDMVAEGERFNELEELITALRAT